MKLTVKGSSAVDPDSGRERDYLRCRERETQSACGVCVCVCVCVCVVQDWMSVTMSWRKGVWSLTLCWDWWTSDEGLTRTTSCSCWRETLLGATTSSASGGEWALPSEAPN